MAGPYELQSPKDIAMEYGGNKQKIAQAAQIGLVDPTAAVLAGMFIDKMRTAQQEEMAPQTTVAQEVMAAPQMAAGLGATPQAAMAPTEAGVAALPVPDEMVPNEFAGGGIVAFANGGGVSLSDVLRTLTMDEAKMYQQTGRLPARAQAMLTGQTAMPAAPMPGMGKAGTGPATISLGGPDVPQTPFPSDVSFFPGIAPLIDGQAANVRPVSTPSPSDAVEAIIAQAERGEGPNVSRPKTVNLTPQGLGVAEKAPSEVALVTPEGQKLIPSQGMSVADFKARQKEFGIGDDVDAELRQQIEALAAGSKGDREQAKYMAMLQAGLGIMGGTSPYALQNIATGAQKGVAQYATDIKDIKKEERDLMKLRGELARAEDARKRGDFKTFQDANDKARKLEVDLYQAESGRMVAQAQKARAAAAGSGITLSQMANLRMKAEKEVDPASVRNALAKQKNLSKIPRPGENKKFDADVEAAYEAEIEKRVQRALGGATRGSSGATRDLSGYRIVPEDDQ
jgi:hypothetical protein